jgi:hypothetical protein
MRMVPAASDERMDEERSRHQAGKGHAHYIKRYTISLRYHCAHRQSGQPNFRKTRQIVDAPRLTLSADSGVQRIFGPGGSMGQCDLSGRVGALRVAAAKPIVFCEGLAGGLTAP